MVMGDCPRMNFCKVQICDTLGYKMIMSELDAEVTVQNIFKKLDSN